MAEMDERYMREALALARRSAEGGDVPVGAVMVRDGEIIAACGNARERERVATAHAECRAIEAACRALGGWHLTRCTLYVTLEPCPMCAGAAVNARVDRVVFGARDPKAGAFGSALDLNAFPLNHHPAVEGGVLEADCAALLSAFFREKRLSERQAPRNADKLPFANNDQNVKNS